MKQLIIVLTGITLSVQLMAQQTPLSNFYNFNEYLLNPAEAGFRNTIEGTASHRIQWQGLEGAPKTTFFGVHGSLNEKMGLGIKINVDQTDILKQFNAAASYAYRIKLNEEAKLHFGLSGMLVQNSVGYSDAVVGDLADEVVNGSDQSGITFDAEAGVMLEYGKGRLGIAAAHLFESGADYELPDNRGTGTFDRVRQFSIYGSYKFNVSDDWNVEPFALFRNQGVESFQAELSTLGSYKEILYLGAGYRQEAGVIARIGFQVTDELIAAYAYEFSGTGVASYSNGSHEFMLGYKIGRKEKKAKEVVKVEPVEVPEVIPPEVEEKIEEVVEPVKEEIEEVIPKPVVEEVEEKPEELHSKEVEELFQDKIVFSFEGNKIPESIKKDLDEIALVLVNNRKERVRIEGHTSTDGTDAQNKIVSERRANLVKEYLKSKGVNEEQMETKAMLYHELLVPDTTLENKKINRRAEIELIDYPR